MTQPVTQKPSVAAVEDLSNAAAVADAAELLRRDGALIVRRAIAAPLLKSLSTMVNEWYQRFLSGAVENYSLGEETATVIPDVWQDAFTEPRGTQSFRKWNVAGLDPRIVPLVDAAPLYDVAHAFVGPELMVTKTQMIVIPSGCKDSPYLHTDAGSMGDVVESMDASPVMVSAQIFLSDLPEIGMGNFTCVPSSHVRRFPWPEDNVFRSQIRRDVLGGTIPAEQQFQVQARAGDIVFFTHALWHGAGPNHSPVDRHSLIVSYAKTFVRPYDYEQTPRYVLERGSRRQRLLFGDLGGWAWRPGCYYHMPPDYLQALLPGDQASGEGRVFRGAAGGESAAG